MTTSYAAIALLLTVTIGQDLERAVPQEGRTPTATVQRGVPQTGRPLDGVPQAGRSVEGVPQMNPDGSRPRIVPRWRAPVTVIYGQAGADVIPYPFQFNLPAPARGLVWRRIGNDAVLYDLGRATILEIRQRWFG